MRGLVVFLIIVVVMATFSFVVLSTGKTNNKTIEKKENKIFEFSTFTSAVCENKGELVHCKDEFFVNCNGEITKAADVAECNGIKLEAPKALGFATFDKDWKDPRV